MSALVLISGGMDSTIALFHTLQRWSEPAHVLSFDYGQRHVNELEAAREVVEIAEKWYPGRIGRKFLGIGIEGIPRVGSLMDPDCPVDHYDGEPQGEDSSFIPYRNLLFMTVGAMWAHKLRADLVVTGIRGGFPDCTEDFEHLVAMVINMADPQYRMHFSSPVHVSRAESLRLASSIPGCMEALAYSLTCFEGQDPPCGTCLPCIKRAQGFAEAGIVDPLIERGA